VSRAFASHGGVRARAVTAAAAVIRGDPARVSGRLPAPENPSEGACDAQASHANDQERRP